MNRREAVARLAAITGVMAVGSEFFLSGCRAPDAAHRSGEIAPADVALLDEIGETIIPATDTPGAKAVGIGAFMARMARDCYDDASYGAFRDGIAAIADQRFMQRAPAERVALLNALDREQREHSAKRTAGDAYHYFRLMKELTLLGYFSSEVGCTKAMRYVESPGRYDGNVPYHKGDRAWYNPARRIS